MPVISMFYGIIVLMYSFDDKQHRQPHPRGIRRGVSRAGYSVRRVLTNYPFVPAGSSGVD
jgi:hypothetical protein